MLVTTTNNVEGRRVLEYKGLVAGEAILGANIFKDLFAGIRDIVGGRSAAYEQELVSLGVVLNRARDHEEPGVVLNDGGPVGRDRVFMLHEDVLDIPVIERRVREILRESQPDDQPLSAAEALKSIRTAPSWRGTGSTRRLGDSLLRSSISISAGAPTAKASRGVTRSRTISTRSTVNIAGRSSKFRVHALACIGLLQDDCWGTKTR